MGNILSMILSPIAVEELHQLRSQAESAKLVVLPGAHNAEIQPECRPLSPRSQASVQLVMVFAGNSAVGKTSITRRFVEEVFEERNVQTTIGFGYYTKTKFINGRTVTIKIIDTIGSERFHAVFANAYKKAVGAFLVFSVADVQSFNTISKWFDEVKQNMPENSTNVLLANKCDLIDTENQDNQVPDSKIESFAEQNGLKYFKTSAKTGQGIHDAFEYCVKECLTGIDQGLISVKNTAPLQPTSPDESSTGCGKGCSVL